MFAPGQTPKLHETTSFQLYFFLFLFTLKRHRLGFKIMQNKSPFLHRRGRRNKTHYPSSPRFTGQPLWPNNRNPSTTELQILQKVIVPSFASFPFINRGPTIRNPPHPLLKLPFAVHNSQPPCMLPPTTIHKAA